ncbi:MAG TPA: class I SAM-dependent methyltransferase, partial [Bryobacteraceae bacterium]
DVFDKDATVNTGYLYTHTSRLSCKLATRRTTEIILQAGEMAGRSVLDLACGDAFYSLQFWDQSNPSRMVAADGAFNALKVAAQNRGSRPISFLVSDAHSLPFPDNSFDLVLVQSVLHHDDDPLHMLREAFRVAPRVLIHEPNGNNIGLKVIEKTSRYHIEHGEKSYNSRRMKRWIEEAGASVVYMKVAGFVPMFCPDWMARAMKLVEPAIEWIPLFRWMACAVYVMVGVRKQT